MLFIRHGVVVLEGGFSQLFMRKSLIVLLFYSLVPFIYHFQTPITFIIGEDSRTVRTYADTVEEFIESQDIQLNNYDRLIPTMDTEIKKNMTIQLKLAKKVILNYNGKEEAVYTTAKSVQEVLIQQGIKLKKYDKVNPSIKTTVKEGMEIKIDPSFIITLIDGKEQREIRTYSDTVSDFLHEQKIHIDKLDRIEPSPEEKITNGMEIRIIRVEKQVETKEEKIPFKTITKENNSISKGERKVIKRGQNGLIEKQYEVTFENKRKKNEKLIESKVVKEPIAQVVEIGTKEEKELIVESTAYTADCSGCTGITAIGIDLKSNPNKKVVAVDPEIIPLGSKVWVEGYGQAIAGDTGRDITGHRIDIFIPDEAKAKQYGRKKVKLKILS